MSRELLFLHGHHYQISRKPALLLCTRNFNVLPSKFQSQLPKEHPARSMKRASLELLRPNTTSNGKSSSLTIAAIAGREGGGRVPSPPLDLTEDNVRQVLADAREEFGQLFDTEVGITGEADLAELDGPFVKISLKGRFWHKRSTVLARLANYLKQRIPEILEVDIENEKQLDDSPENF
ncbi:hypothetical protein JCGZ_06427 [Jatropha curcas]|uniref:NIF system FeS cluster assembly NifU C-terminal domain-containing protein n=1 Tax=Jatropha curcas TaxID=180498 RepID=A0A067J9A9_JATCU|nr:uncharacterized protein LOC105650382 [Jatropha curcas]KDP20341.1 hypothetical protein JCGZ_06427 [Jatropha curcas]